MGDTLCHTQVWQQCQDCETSKPEPLPPNEHKPSNALSSVEVKHNKNLDKSAGFDPDGFEIAREDCEGCANAEDSRQLGIGAAHFDDGNFEQPVRVDSSQKHSKSASPYTSSVDGDNPASDPFALGSERKPSDVQELLNIEDAEVSETEDAARSRMSFRQAVKKAMVMVNTTSKVHVNNKIGQKVEGWFREVALVLQNGIVAESKHEYMPGFDAPESELFSRAREACGFPRQRYFAAMGLQEGRNEPSLSLVGTAASSGKSNAFFLLSPDQQLMAKSCTREDWETLLRILPKYVKFFEQRTHEQSSSICTSSGLSRGRLRGFSGSLLPRFVGLYSFTVGNDKMPVRVLVMANVFGGACKITRRYDLKGSTFGRRASQKECRKATPVFKDLDWLEREKAIRVLSAERDLLRDAIAADVKFLAEQGLMDYSLLVGVHDLPQNSDGPGYEAMKVVTLQDETRYCYLGIVDVLTPYGPRKKAETLVTGKLMCRDVSCQHPVLYAERFKSFVQKNLLIACD